MGLNVSMDYNFRLENRENLRNAAKNILDNGGAPSEATQRIIDKTLFEKQEINPQLSIIKASTQISVNNTLKETLKYLKSHANQKVHKTPMLGDLWNVFSANNEASEQNPYKGELIDFKIDNNAKNIFAA